MSDLLREGSLNKFGPSPQSRQTGLTLVELLVALAISAVIAMAAVSALIISRQGFTTVDAAAQLRDNARFATELIQRIGVQAGFRDVEYAASLHVGVADPAPNVMGFNNATASAADPTNIATPRTSTSSPGYGSDVLVMRYQVASTFPGSGVSDMSMIDCAGNASTVAPIDRDERVWSVIHVAFSATDGELNLMCTSANPKTGAISVQPIIRGVENFQVLYGAVGVLPNTAPAPIAGPVTSVADRYLRADQMTVAGDSVGTNANWRRVRSIRVGMILRAPVGSSVESNSNLVLYPLGLAKDSSGGAEGSALASFANDPGTVYSPPADRRLRQVVTFTVHLRNEQGL